MKKLMVMIGAAAAALGLFADTPSNYYSNSFEADDGGCSSGTAFDWSAASWSYATGAENPALDTQVAAGLLPYATGRVRRDSFFANGSVNEKYLKLETGTNTLSHGIAAGQTYIDQLVKFTGFEEAQTTFDANAKIAVWMSAIETEGTAQIGTAPVGTPAVGTEGDPDYQPASEDYQPPSQDYQPASADYVAGETNLYVAVGTDSGTTNVKLNYSVQPDTWYRLTVKSLGNVNTSVGLGTQLGFQIFINGEPVSIVADQQGYNGNSEQFTGPAKALYQNGQLFTSMTSDGTVASVGYKGIGSIDDLVISQDAPDFDAAVEFSVVPPTGVEVDRVECDGVVLTDLKVLPNKTVRIYLKAAPGYRLDLPAGYIEKTITGAGSIDLTDDLEDKLVEGYAMVVTPGDPAVTNIYGDTELYTAIGTVKDGDTVTFLKNSTINDGEKDLYSFTEGTTIAVAQGGVWTVNVAECQDECYLVNNVGAYPGKVITATLENTAVGFVQINGTIQAGASITVGGTNTIEYVDGTTDLTIEGTLKAVAVSLGEDGGETPATAKITLVNNGKVITKTDLDLAAAFTNSGVVKSAADADGYYTYSLQAAPTTTGFAIIIANNDPVYYPTLAAAIDAYQGVDNERVAFLEAYTAPDAELTINKSVNIDLNGQIVVMSNITITAGTTKLINNTFDPATPLAGGQGGLTLAGKVAVSANAKIDMSDLAFGTVYGGVIGCAGGIDLASGAEGVFYKWNVQPEMDAINSANWMFGNYPAFFTDSKVVVGSKVTIGTTTWTGVAGNRFALADEVATATLLGQSNVEGQASEEFTYVESFDTVAAALTACKAAGTVTLTANYTQSENIDLAGKTLVIGAGATLTIGGDVVVTKNGGFIQNLGSIVVADGKTLDMSEFGWGAGILPAPGDSTDGTFAIKGTGAVKFAAGTDPNAMITHNSGFFAGTDNGARFWDGTTEYKFATDTWVEPTYVAQIGETKYETAAAALAAVQALEVGDSYEINVNILANELTVNSLAGDTLKVFKDETITITKGSWVINGAVEYDGAVAGTFKAEDITVPASRTISLGADAQVIATNEIADASFAVPEGDYELKVEAGTAALAGYFVYSVALKQVDPVAKIGDTPYATLAAAFAEAQENDKIVLQKNVGLTECLMVTDFKGTLDLNGFELTNDESYQPSGLTWLAKVVNSDLTVTNGTITVKDGHMFYVMSAATMTVAANTTIAEIGDIENVFRLYGKTTTDNTGVITGTATLNVYGTITRVTGTQAGKDCEMGTIDQCLGDTVVNVYEGAVLSHTSGRLFKMSGGTPTVNVYGGVLTAGSLEMFHAYSSDGNNVKIEGGTFNMNNLFSGNAAGKTLNVSGLGAGCTAKFSTATSVYQSLAYFCAEGYAPVLGQDSYYTIQPVYDITITEPTNGTLETSVTNAIAAGTTVTVTATPTAHYTLGAIMTNGVAIVGNSFVMPAMDVTVSATFNEQPGFVIQIVNAGNKGTLTVSDVGVKKYVGETITGTIGEIATGYIAKVFVGGTAVVVANDGSFSGTVTEKSADVAVSYVKSDAWYLDPFMRNEVHLAGDGYSPVGHAYDGTYAFHGKDPAACSKVAMLNVADFIESIDPQYSTEQSDLPKVGGQVPAARQLTVSPEYGVLLYGQFSDCGGIVARKYSDAGLSQEYYTIPTPAEGLLSPLAMGKDSANLYGVVNEGGIVYKYTVEASEGVITGLTKTKQYNLTDNLYTIVSYTVGGRDLIYCSDDGGKKIYVIDTQDDSVTTNAVTSGRVFAANLTGVANGTPHLICVDKGGNVCVYAMSADCKTILAEDPIYSFTRAQMGAGSASYAAGFATDDEKNFIHYVQSSTGGTGISEIVTEQKPTQLIVRGTFSDEANAEDDELVDFGEAANVTFDAPAGKSITAVTVNGVAVAPWTAADSYTFQDAALVKHAFVKMTLEDKTFTVTFLNEDSSEYAVSNNVPYNTAFADVKPADPTKTGYTFAGWTPEGAAVTADATYTATFAEIKVDSITLDITSTNVAPADVFTLVATVSPETALDTTIAWTTSDEKIATVANGTVTAVAAGTATITATNAASGVFATCTVTVQAAVQPVNPEDPSTPYANQKAAEDAADAINANKATMINTPSGANAADYTALFTAVVTADNRVVVELNETGTNTLQTSANTLAAAVQNLGNSEANVTVAAPAADIVPGFYYGLGASATVGGEKVVGSGLWKQATTDGITGGLSAAKPAGNAGFFQIKVSVTNPVK